MHTRIAPGDEAAVIWLQRALNRLLPWPRPFVVGQLDELTVKGIQAYQNKYGLPVTERSLLQGREVSEELLQHIQQQLRARNLTIS